MRVVKRIAPFSALRIAGLLYGCLGVLIGAILSLVSVVGLAIAPREGGVLLGFLFGTSAVVVLPIFYGVLGAVMGAFAAWLYNLAARWVGGLEVQVD